ncbi:MAG: hypothetical protein ACE5EU_03470 [Paracoccaceae bacterium]
MRNGWKSWVIDRRRAARAALALLVASSSAVAIWGLRRTDGSAGLFRDRCGSCHDLPDISRYGRNEVAGIVRTMRQHLGADQVISEREAGAISRYLEEMTTR